MNVWTLIGMAMVILDFLIPVMKIIALIFLTQDKKTPTPLVVMDVEMPVILKEI